MTPDNHNRQHFFLPLLAGIAVVTALYLASDFILPIVLAGLLSFLLAPLLKVLERWGVGRITSVLIASLLSFTVIAGVCYVVVSQLLDFAEDLPKYRSNLLAKVAAVREQSSGGFGNAVATVQEVIAAMNPAAKEGGTIINQPMPVVVQSGSPISMIQGLLVPLLGPLGNAAMVAIIVIFMLLGREDLRDRLIHLVGRGHLRITTEALDEAGSRVSRYLRAQLLVNVLYGIPIAIGLYFIGVPNAALWGVLAIVLRFLPYLGPWLAAAFPLFLSLAVSSGWTQLLLTITLFVVVELISNNFVEPWLYGASTGLSPLAVIVSAFFWTWLWGIAGLVLATPLTVCFAVAGKYVPGLGFLDVLLGENPPIEKSERLSQRLLALDEEESCELAENAVKERGLARAADEVLLPSLRTLESDTRAGLLAEKNRAAAYSLLRQICAELAVSSPPEGPAVLCLPALNEADEIVALLLRDALHARGVAASVPSSKLLISEGIELAAAAQPPVICIVSFPPLSVLVAANLCHRLRERLPSTHLTVLLWQPDDEEFARRRQRLKRRGAYDVFSIVEHALPTLAVLSGCEPQADSPGKVSS